MFPVDKIVKVNEYIQAGGLGFVNFGKAMAFVLSDELNSSSDWDKKTIKIFSTIDDAVEYFADTTQSYMLISRWFAAGGGDLSVYLRDENNDSVTTSATDARGKNWFYSHFWTKEVTESQSNLMSLADWSDANKCYLWAATSEPDVADPNKSDDIASNMLARGNRHFSLGYRQAETVIKDPSQIYFMTGLAVEFSKVNYAGLQTAITGEFKSIVGAISENLSPSEITALEKKKVVMYVTTVEGDQTDHGVVLNSWSMSSKNEHMDDVMNVDAMASGLRVSVYNEFKKSRRVGLTPRGQAQMIGAGDALLKTYYDNGVLGAGEIPNPLTGEMEYCEFGYKIYTVPEDALRISSANEVVRKLYPINTRVNLGRAGHSLVFDLTIQ